LPKPPGRDVRQETGALPKEKNSGGLRKKRTLQGKANTETGCEGVRHDPQPRGQDPYARHTKKLARKHMALDLGKVKGPQGPVKKNDGGGPSGPVTGLGRKSQTKKPYKTPFFKKLADPRHQDGKKDTGKGNRDKKITFFIGLGKEEGQTHRGAQDPRAEDVGATRGGCQRTRKKGKSFTKKKNGTEAAAKRKKKKITQEAQPQTRINRTALNGTSKNIAKEKGNSERGRQGGRGPTKPAPQGNVHTESKRKKWVPQAETGTSNARSH